MSRSNKRLSSSGISDKVVRILEIYTLLAQNRYPDVSYLTEKFEVSRRSVFRYLEIINMLDPIKLDEDRKGYRFVKSDRIKKLALTEDEFTLLLTFGETVSHLGSPLKDHFHKFVERLTSVTRASNESPKLPIMVRIPDAIEGENFAEHFQLISEGLLEKCGPVFIEMPVIFNMAPRYQPFRGRISETEARKILEDPKRVKHLKESLAGFSWGEDYIPQGC